MGDRLEMAGRAMSTPLGLRLVYYTTALATTAGLYLWTRSGDLQLLALALFCVAIVPLLDRFVMPRAAVAADEEVADYKPSWRVVTTGTLLSLAWLVAANFLVPDFGLGPAVGILVVIIPAGEFYCWLGKRERATQQAQSYAPH